MLGHIVDGTSLNAAAGRATLPVEEEREIAVQIEEAYCAGRRRYSDHKHSPAT